MKKENVARFMLITSMTVFGTIGLFVRNIALSSGEIAFFRAVLATLLVGGYLLVTGKRIDIRGLGRDAAILVLSGVAIGFNWILLFEAYKYTTVSVATISYYFAPVLVTLLCPFIFREKMTAKKWICFVLSTAGLVLITGFGNLSEGQSHLKGVLLGLGAATLYATVIILNKLIRGIDGIERSFLQFVSASVVLGIYVLLDGGFEISALDGIGWVCLILVGLLHTGVTYCMYFSSLRELSGQQTAVLSYIDPLVAVLISVTFLHESMSLPQIIGGVLILGAAIWNELPEKAKGLKKTIE